MYQLIWPYSQYILHVYKDCGTKKGAHMFNFILLHNYLGGLTHVGPSNTGTGCCRQTRPSRPELTIVDEKKERCLKEFYRLSGSLQPGLLGLLLDCLL